MVFSNFHVHNISTFLSRYDLLGLYLSANQKAAHTTSTISQLILKRKCQPCTALTFNNKQNSYFKP